MSTYCLKSFKKNHILYLPICTYICISICSLKNKKITFAHDLIKAN